MKHIKNARSVYNGITRNGNLDIRIYVFALLAVSLLLIANFWHAKAAEGYEFVTAWGNLGNGDGQFQSPSSVAMDSAGNVYVADANNHRIQKFDSSGTFITKWGRLGHGVGNFNNPRGIAVDSADNVYVADANNDLIQKFDSMGNFITQWGYPGTNPGAFGYPRSVAVDSADNVYVADRDNNRIQKFDSMGNFIAVLLGPLWSPVSVAVDSAGNVYVGDITDRIHRFNSFGSYEFAWGSSGTGEGQFDLPLGVTVDSADNVYVADTNNQRIQKFDSSGTFITKWGSSGTGDGQFRYPLGSAVAAGNVYVADSGNNRIQKFALAAPTTGTGVIMRVSTDSAGGSGGGNDASISADGRYVAFHSYASTLVPGDVNGAMDVFLKDTRTGATTLISTDSAGGQGDYRSEYPSLSAEGRYLAFWSDASNLVPDDTNGTSDIFLKDILTGTTTRVSTDSAGGQASSTSDDPSISADGRFVAFNSIACYLVPGKCGRPDVFLKDVQTGITTLVSTDSAGVQGNAQSYGASLSADGRYVVFTSYADNLVPLDTNGQEDVFRKDTLTGAITRISTDSVGGEANGYGSQSPSVSANGRYIAFDSDASNLVPGDVNGRSDVFLKDTQTGATTLISTDSGGEQGNNGSYGSSISADGRHVTFISGASNLVPGDTNGKTDVFLKDILTGSTSRISTDAAGREGVGVYGSYDASISADGRFVAFESGASNLVPDDSHDGYDVFLAATSACGSGAQPALSLTKTGAHWASYADYTAGLLSVDFDISNTGTETAYQIGIAGAVNTQGVSLFSSAFADGFMIAGGGGAPGTLKYSVPAGVGSFFTTFYATALDRCGNSYSYPGPYPGS